MSCFLETAKKGLQSKNRNYSSTKKAFFTSLATSSSPSTTIPTACGNVNNVIFESRDINEDNNQDNTNKSHTKKAENSQKSRKTESQEKPAVAAVVTNKQKLVKECSKLRQQQPQQLKDLITTDQDDEVKARGAEEVSEKGLFTLEPKIRIDTSEGCGSISPSHGLLSRLKQRTDSTTEHPDAHSCDKNNTACGCYTTRSSWPHTLHSLKQLDRRHATTPYNESTARAACNTATAVPLAGGSSQILRHTLQRARDHLAAYLATASTCFLQNLTSYAAAATTPHAAGSQRKLTKRPQKSRSQLQAQQQKTKCGQCHVTAAHIATSRPLQPCFTGNNEHHGHKCNVNSYSHSPHYHYYGNSLRNLISLCAASSVVLVLCYLTTVTSAAASNLNTVSIDKHPIHSIDWSKFDESSSDKEILDLLLENKRYDKRLLPPVNDEDFCCGLSSPDMAKDKTPTRTQNRGTLTVNVNVLLLSLASPDESSLKYEVEFLLNQQWTDPRLQYGNKSKYEFLNALHHHDSIWTPDTYFIMHGDFKDPIIPMHFKLRIFRNGTITYAMRRHLILSCQGSLHIFPFDDPKCSFSMESISYEEDQIKYVWKNDEDTLRKSPSLTTLNAYLIKNQTTACDQNSWRGNYSCLQVELTFTRDRAYYFTTVFIPGIILVTSSFITFWLEWNAVPARVMIGVTTMLNFFTTSNGFRSTLPVVSNLTAMNVWDGVCMCFIYASLLEFVCVNYVGRKRPLHNVVYRPGENPVTQRLPAVLSRIGVILASPLGIIEREFHAALSSEKAAAGVSSGASTLTTPPTAATTATHTVPMEQQHGSIIGAAVQHLRTRSIRYRKNPSKNMPEPVYAEPAYVASTANAAPSPLTTSAAQTATATVLTLEDGNPSNDLPSGPHTRHSRSMSTNTPPLVQRNVDPVFQNGATSAAVHKTVDVDGTGLQTPVKPPRKKTSRSTSPAGVFFIEISGEGEKEGAGIAGAADGGNTGDGEKRREASAPNEIVACTSCGGGNSPCTHSANNGCATETCFVQVRKKEPPHPIRVAKTIDVIARITFPTAYSIFLIFFFVHYKGFS